MGALRLIEGSNTLNTSPEIVILPATRDHVLQLIDTIREDDKKEIESYGFSYARGIWKSYRHGLKNTTGLINGKVGAIWGVGGDYIGEVGQPWLLTSSEVHNISPLKFARIYQKEVKKMLELFPILVNYVANEYTEAIRLLDIVGFTIGEPRPMGKKGALYRKFEMRV